MLRPMPNIELTPYPNPSTYRMLAANVWDHPYDPHVYGSLEVRCEKLEAWIAEKRKTSGEKVTVSHAVARGLAMIIAKHPDLNSLVRLGSLYRRKDIDIFMQIVVEDGESIGKTDLSGIKLKNADRLTVVEMGRMIRERALKIRAGNDEEFNQTKKGLAGLPGFLIKPVLRFLDFLQYTLNVNPKFLGTPGDPFGSAMVTNVGVFGLTIGYAPFFPLARTPLIVTLGAIEEKPVVEDGKIVIGRVLHINGTFDHRVVDGYHGGVVAREIKALLENPERLDVAQG
jgi:pyruvate/2-oxoglutarate dehydrogenase complex dihydrolipoamide acyltransferase (E2) component